MIEYTDDELRVMAWDAVAHAEAAAAKANLISSMVVAPQSGEWSDHGMDLEAVASEMRGLRGTIGAPDVVANVVLAGPPDPRFPTTAACCTTTADVALTDAVVAQPEASAADAPQANVGGDGRASEQDLADAYAIVCAKYAVVDADARRLRHALRIALGRATAAHETTCALCDKPIQRMLKHAKDDASGDRAHFECLEHLIAGREPTGDESGDRTPRGEP